MRRVVVVGSSGAGKSTFARELAARLDLTHIELDALFHRENWKAASLEEFRADLRRALDEADAATDGWTVCGNYNSQTDGIHVDRADTLVWLDLSKAIVMRRIIWRTISRAISREELWNGNREPLTNFYRWDPEVNVIRWAWVHFAKRRSGYEAKLADGSWDHLAVHRLRTAAEVDTLLELASSLSGEGCSEPR